MSLQVGPASPQAAALGLEDFAPFLTDFAETAAAIDGLDLVVSVDTSVAHAAAAMGKPTWIMLPHCPEWRWLHGRSDSPWYDGVRLFRQRRVGDWRGCIESVVTALAEIRPGHADAPSLRERVG